MRWSTITSIVTFAFLLGCSDEKVAGVTTVETENAFIPMGRLSGYVEIPEGVNSALVKIVDTDYSTETDSVGYFVFDSIPAADYTLQVSVGDSSLILQVRVLENEENDVTDLMAGYVDIVDFESGDYSTLLRYPATFFNWYFAHQGDSVISTPSDTNAIEGIEDAGAGREGLAFHWKSSSPNGSWAYFGTWLCAAENPCDFTAVDSIVYYIRGTGRYSFALESLGDENYSGKALYHDTLTVSDEWIRKSITPSDFVEGDSVWGNLGFDMIKDKVTNITIPAYGDAEIWIDDIRIYGITRNEMRK